ncbi:taurine dioxygenase [Tepidicaulis marinus]|uniref:Taurine dioxygenase n=1 Tax=Tepidicaulis marinus TaxID=1333998 RepID=A0A081BAL7_9HYPH|nr:TauD/TfdA family dioxygenase [Tepidicaulis marinus]GAK45085.1 taurine dioxygenase [Tepidicaulis marinus]
MAYRHIEVRANETGFGAEIKGLDLSAPLAPQTLEEVKRAWAEHGVVWFPDQPLELEALERFTEEIGPFGHDPFIKPMADHPHVLELRREPDEKATNFGAGWHSDWSFQETPPAATLLHSKVVPPKGGDTLYADCTRAYEALSPAMKELLAPLNAVHSAILPYSKKGIFAQEKEKRTMQIITSDEAEKTQAHPLVRTHPVTGRKALYVSPVYTVGIEGMSNEESQWLLGGLYQHMTKPEFIYRHKWRENMLVMWDNRSTLHFAEGGYDGYLRVMHRTTVAGEKPL